MRTSVRLPPERQSSGLQPDNLAGPFLVPQSPPPLSALHSFLMISHSVSHGIPDGLLKRACAFHHAAFFACSFRNTIFTAKSGFAAATAKPGMCAGVRFFFSVSGSIIALKRSPNTCRWAVAGQQVSTPGFPKRQHQRAPRSCCSLRTMVARLGASYFEKCMNEVARDSVWVSPSEVHQTVLLRWRASAHGRWAACWVRRRPGHPFAPCCTGPSPFHTWRTRSSALHSPTTQVRRQ